MTYHATDVYGNDEYPQNLTVLIDSVAPQTSIALAGIGGIGDVFVSSVRVTLTATDSVLADGSAGSDVQTTEYNLNNGQTWQTYTGPFTISTLGQTTIQYRSLDVAGNVEGTHSRMVTLVPVLPPSLP